MKWLLLCVFLTGCSVFSEPKMVTEKVEVPIPVPCVSKAEVPEPPRLESSNLQEEDSIGRKVQALLVDRKELQKSFTKARGLLVGCVNEPKS
jgi:hypothetical protein